MRRPRLDISGIDTASVVTWYRDNDERDQGEMVVWLDNEDRVSGFELSYARWPRGHEHIAEWTAGKPLLIGEVDTGEHSGDHGPRRHMSPVVRRIANPDPATVKELFTYFTRNAGVLPVAHRTAIGRILADALERRV